MSADFHPVIAHVTSVIGYSRGGVCIGNFLFDFREVVLKLLVCNCELVTYFVSDVSHVFVRVVRVQLRIPLDAESSFKQFFWSEFNCNHAKSLMIKVRMRARVATGSISKDAMKMQPVAMLSSSTESVLSLFIVLFFGSVF